MYSLRVKKSIHLHLCTKFHLVICLLGWAIKCSVGCVSTSVWLTRYIRAFYLLPMQNLTLILPWDVFAFKKIHTVWVYRWVVRKFIFVICRVWLHVRVSVTWIWTDAEQIYFFYFDSKAQLWELTYHLKISNLHFMHCAKAPMISLSKDFSIISCVYGCIYTRQESFRGLVCCINTYSVFEYRKYALK